MTKTIIPSSFIMIMNLKHTLILIFLTADVHQQFSASVQEQDILKKHF